MSDKLKHARVLVLGGSFYLIGDRRIPRANDAEKTESTGSQSRAGRADFDRAQAIALEKAKTEKEASGEFESECPGNCGAQDTFYVGNMKGVGRIYQQTFIDTYSKVVCAKLYDRKTPITAADLLNDRVVPFFEEKEVSYHAC